MCYTIRMNPLENKTAKISGITGQCLKVLAVVSMIIDHIGYAIVIRLPGAADTGSLTNFVYTTLRMIGRFAFPIYCFLLIEGVCHTRNIGRYAFRLFIFALVSEIPFDLAFYGKLFHFDHQNVFFTLCIGVLMLWAFKLIGDTEEGRLPRILLRVSVMVIPPAYVAWRIGYLLLERIKLSLNPVIVYSVCAIAAMIVITVFVTRAAGKYNERTALILCADLIVLSFAAFAADILMTDYKAAGIIAIALMYLYKNDNVSRIIYGTVALTVLSSPTEAFAFLDAIPASFYNGRRGKGTKYLFYVVYPLHLLILYLIARYLRLWKPTVL